jgi:3-methyladenine DNA glycosylase AlkD
MTTAPAVLVGLIRRALAERANPERAAGQQAYMRSALPYHGLIMPEVRRVVGELCRRHRLPDAGTWGQAIRDLWDGVTHREQWYAALVLARFRSYASWAQDLGSLPLWEHLIRTGAWWDVNDEITQHLIGPMLAAHPEPMTATLRSWATDPDLWIRRAAILAQNGRRSATDVDLLAYCIRAGLEDRDFFSRKAIGWALREYSKTDPQWVTRFVAAHGDRMSGLSRREATRLIR